MIYINGWFQDLWLVASIARAIVSVMCTLCATSNLLARHQRARRIHLSPGPPPIPRLRLKYTLNPSTSPACTISNVTSQPSQHSGDELICLQTQDLCNPNTTQPWTRLINILQPHPPSIGALKLRDTTYKVSAFLNCLRLLRLTGAAQPKRNMGAMAAVGFGVDVRDLLNKGYFYFMLQKYSLGQVVFSVSQPGAYARRLANRTRYRGYHFSFCWCSGRRRRLRWCFVAFLGNHFLQVLCTNFRAHSTLNPY